MTFLHLQLALAGLACVGIPILIHLLMRRRRKPVMWGAMRFLVEAYRKHRRRLMIEKWLLLATRCLLVALLALAIGRPLIGAIMGGATRRTVYVLIDNGLASGARGADGAIALDRHKKTARDILDAMLGGASEGDRAALVGLGAPADGVVLPVSADIAAVKSLLDDIQAVESRTDIPSAIAMVAAAIQADRSTSDVSEPSTLDMLRPAKGAGQTFVVVLSDLLEGSADLSATLSKLPDGVRLIASTPAETSPGNVAVTSVEPLRSVVVTGKATSAGDAGAATLGGASSAGDRVAVTLRRWGPLVSQQGSSQVVLSMAGVRDRGTGTTFAEVGRTEIRWAPGQEMATTSLQGARRGVGTGGSDADRGGGSSPLTEVLEVRVEGMNVGENAVAGDDTWRRPVEVRDALRVGIVSPRRFGARERVDRLEASEWLRLALRPGDDADIDVTEMDPTLLDGARLAGLDALCLPRPDLLTAEHWPRLRLFLENGGMLLVMPPNEPQVHLWPDAMVKELGLTWRIAREAKVYGGEGSLPGMIAPTASGRAERGDILSLISSEIDDLARSVSIWKVLPVDMEQGDSRPLVALSDGVPLVIAHAYSGASLSDPANTASHEKAPAAASHDERGASVNEAGGRGLSRGLIVYIAVAPDLEWTDLPAKPLMVPLLQELVREGIGRAHGSWWSIAGERPTAPQRTAELRKVEGDDSATGAETRVTVVTIDEMGLTSEALRRAGLWQAVDDRGAVRGVVAMNPDTRGSRTQAQEQAAMEQWLGRAAVDSKVVWVDSSNASSEQTGGAAGSAATILARESPGSPISLPLLIGALVVAVFELWLARWASHAEVASGRRKGVAA